ncbi:unnamed protein product [Pleuronectes platessa]|uniref:Uncharacterized protein n=1 Tax=Pleuronectes platessa TaxID=8262 RepID=A0A9N7VXS7_PLEPL|nr:unnamed protein product [Pleuronectes platessa]
MRRRSRIPAHSLRAQSQHENRRQDVADHRSRRAPAEDLKAAATSHRRFKHDKENQKVNSKANIPTERSRE